MDRYDKAIEYLRAHPERVIEAYINPEREGGALFESVDGLYSCPRFISNGYITSVPEYDDYVRKTLPFKGLFKDNEEELTYFLDNLENFAKCQREAVRLGMKTE